MAYTDQSAIEAEFGEDEVLRSADRDGDDVIDTIDGIDVVTLNCEKASGTVDGYLSAKYSVPIDPVTDSVKGAATAIAMYLLSSWADTLTEDKRRRYEDAIRWLTLVAEGKAGIGGDDVVPKGTRTVRFTSETREWTRSKMGGVL